MTIRSGLDTERFTPRSDLRRRYREEWGVADGEVAVGTIARLFENKGYEEIMAAMPSAIERVGRLRFIWIGDGPHRHRYQRRLEAMGLSDRVRFLGLLEPEVVASCINGFDIVLHASRWEGLPRALAQGLLTGVPAVSFDNDGAPEVVLPGNTGLLVPYGDTAALADAIVALAGDAELRRTLGRAGRDRCLQMFDWRKMVEQIEALYRRLFESPARR